MSDQQQDKEKEKVEKPILNETEEQEDLRHIMEQVIKLLCKVVSLTT